MWSPLSEQPEDQRPSENTQEGSLSTKGDGRFSVSHVTTPSQPERTPNDEDVAHQHHYEALKIQPLEYIVANGFGYMEGNIVKYVSRYKLKGGKKDLLKAREYLNRLIKETE